MTISRDNEEGAVENAAGAERAGLNREASKAPTGTGSQHEDRIGLMHSRSRYHRSLQRTTGSETIGKLTEAITRIIQSSPDHKAYKILVMDGPSNNMAVSAIILALSEDTGTETRCVIQPLIVETRATSLTSRTYIINGATVEMPSTLMDLEDDNAFMECCARIVREHLIRTSKPKPSIVINADPGCQVIPKGFDPEDVNGLHAILFASVCAIETVFEKWSGTPVRPFHIGLISSSDRLSARVEYHPTPITTEAGYPVVSDISVSLINTVRNDSAQSIANSSMMDISRTDGYIDVNLAPPAPMQPQMPGMPMMPPPSQRYYACYNITKITPDADAVHLEDILLALLQTTLLNEKYAWAPVYRARKDFKKGDINPRDIGAIGLELPLPSADGGAPRGRHVDLSKSTPEQLLEFIAAAIHPNLIYCLHVGGDGLTWALRAFLKAAQPTPDMGMGQVADSNARKALFAAANNLTEGKFSQNFPAEGVIAHHTGNKIHLGTYRSQMGTADIRELNTYLAVLNTFGDRENFQTLSNWCDTMYNTGVPLPIRLERRLRILTEMASGFELTGMATPIIIDPMFMGALSKSAHEAGLNITPERMQHLFAGQPVRGLVDAASLAFKQMGGGGVYSYMQGQSQANLGSYWGNTRNWGSSYI